MWGNPSGCLVGVVVVDAVGDESFELMLVPDDCAIEELATDGPDPALRERVRDRRPDRGLEDSPDGGCSDWVAETVQFAVAAAVSPGGVLGRHLDAEATVLCFGWSEDSDSERRRYAWSHTP